MYIFCDYFLLTLGLGCWGSKKTGMLTKAWKKKTGEQAVSLFVQVRLDPSGVKELQAALGCLWG